MSPVPEEAVTESVSNTNDRTRPVYIEQSELQMGEEVFTSESENSSATCKTVRNMGPISPTPSASFGSELSLNAGSEAETNNATRTSSGPMSRLSGAVSRHTIKS